MSPRKDRDRDRGASRSAEERERARLEREARRTGQPLPPRDARPRPPADPAPEAPKPVEPTAEPYWTHETARPDPGADRPQDADEFAEHAPATREAPSVGQPAGPEAGPPAAEPTWLDEAEAPQPPAPEAPATEPTWLDELEPPEPQPEAEPELEPASDPVPAQRDLSWDHEDPVDIQPPPRTRSLPSVRRDAGPSPTDDSPAVRILGAESDGDPDRPLGTKRVAASSLASAAGAQGPPRFGAPPRGTPRSRRGMRRVVPIVLFLIVATVGYGYNRLMQPFHGEGSGSVRIVIPTGSGAGQIGDQLAKAGVVDSGTLFGVRARLSGDRDKLRSGPHTLKKGMSYADAIAALMVAPKVAPTVDVAVPEGLTIKQVGSLARKAGLRGSYTKQTRSSSARARARTLGLPNGKTLLEGFLWPATYRLKTGAQTSALVTDQLRAFKRATRNLDYAFAKQRGLSRYETLIVASLIENEAQVASERPKIAAVIYNRLKADMPLQIDATTRYETENYGRDARPIRQSELDADTPYNTRNRAGLPPTPISSPGLASLQAATKPADVGFLFYVVKPCGNGAHNFSTTDAEFQKDVNAYNAKRTELGGKDPSSC